MTDGKRIEQTEVFAMGLESESKGQSEGKGWGSYLNQESKSELSGVDHASSACDKSPCLTGTSFNRPLSPAAPTTPSLHIRRTTNNAISVFIATLFPPPFKTKQPLYRCSVLLLSSYCIVPFVSQHRPPSVH